jgi:hypothetical protein
MLSVVLLLAQGAAAQEEPSISVAPSTGLADGQTVTVSGGPFPALVGAVVAQCAEPVDQTVESVVSRCQFSFEARFDAEGNLVPASLTVHEIITSVGGPLPGGSTTFDCTVDDCSVGVFGFLLSDNSTLVGAWVPIRFGPDVPTTRADERRLAGPRRRRSAALPDPGPVRALRGGAPALTRLSPGAWPARRR